MRLETMRKEIMTNTDEQSIDAFATSLKNLTPLEIRSKIAQLDSAMKQAKGSLGKDPFTLVHSFVPGMYCREIFAPKGMLIVTQLHKTEHFVFMLRGEVSIISEEGLQSRIKAPCMMISKVGAKRVVFTHEDTTWINVHANPTDLNDIKELEDIMIAKSYAELGLEEPSVTGGVKCLG